MEKFKQLGRSLSTNEQKGIFGGLSGGSQCTCSDGTTTFCPNQSPGSCAAAAIRNCDGTGVVCSDVPPAQN